MDDLNKLAKALMTIDDNLAACMKCGFCQAFCPIFDQTQKEGDVTRGKIALTENLARLVIQDPEAVYEKLSRCLLCGSCAANCPSGVKTLDIFLEARAIFATYMGLSPIKKAIFRTLLPNPKLLDTLLRVSAPFQKLVVRKDEGKVQDTGSAPLLKAFLGDRHIPLLAEQPLRAKVGKLNTPVGKSGIKVAFFPGCMGDKVYTQVSEACLKVFDYHSVGVFLSDNYTCCGTPALASGDRESFVKMLQHNLDILQDANFDYIVAPCASCTETIKEHWPHYAEDLPSSYRGIAKDIASKAIEVNAFIVDVLKVKTINIPKGGTRVTYHESCHLKKSLKVSEQPRKLIHMNDKYNLIEMNEADHCCGCGGSFTLTQPELSAEIGQRKRDNVVHAGVQVVATACPACMMQLSDMLARNNDPIKVKHTVEIYAETLK